METLADLVARDRRGDSPALLADDREMDYRRFCTTAWKASNYLRHLGVAGDRGVVVLAHESPPPVLTFLGAALLDAPTRFVDAVADVGAAVQATNARAVLVPTSEADAVDPPAGVTLSVHGGEPTEPATDHWEGGVWSENPAFVPSSATPDSVALLTPGASVTHGELVAGGRRVAGDLDLDAEDTVCVNASLADPRAVAAGVVAPLLAGSAFRLDAGAVHLAADSPPLVGDDSSTRTVGTDGTADLDLDAVDLSVDE